ncbi:MAG: CPBP family intramembrane metalloprotease [Anaerolineaceae bacterium]|nr:CPBP family intramembrane metalloprotease [Anaerolineaceae bacterium]
MKRYPLLLFFILAFVFSWPIMIIDALGSQGALDFRVPVPLLVLMGYGPTLAALLVTGWTKGKSGIRALLRKLLVWRVGMLWAVVGILGMAGLFFLAYQLSNWLGYPVPAAPEIPMSPIVAVPVLFIVSLLINGEEIGWRGFALPRLQARFNALTASLILGVIWAGFHLPLFWTIGSTQAGQPIFGFLISIVASSIIVTWLYNNTDSLLLVILFHASVNTWSQIIPGIDTAHAGIGSIYWLTTGLLCATAVLITLFFGPETLTRKTIANQKTILPNTL